ncbi:Multicopper oxidase type 2 [Penicillium fimorum]|uniref:Multicopper oxidase type 2 n=1 Tax=Penicillium fimorum TaxID=1882269 RepID=A0A9W9XXS3_9EURO|nr:Multicopper oxidase type 2 [Penicillium fimorum]
MATLKVPLALASTGLMQLAWANPGPDVPRHFHLISNNTQDVKAMQKAEENPQLVIPSDWDHLTSSEYHEPMKDSSLDIT